MEIVAVRCRGIILPHLIKKWIEETQIEISIVE